MNKQTLYKLNYDFCKKANLDTLTVEQLNEVLTPDATFNNEELYEMLKLASKGIKIEGYTNFNQVTDLDSKVNTPEALTTCAMLINYLPLKELPDNRTIWNLLAYTVAYVSDKEDLENEDIIKEVYMV